MKVWAQMLLVGCLLGCTALSGDRLFEVTAYHRFQAGDAVLLGPALRDVQGRMLTLPMRVEDWCHAALEGTVEAVGLDGVRRVFNDATPDPPGGLDLQRSHQRSSEGWEEVGARVDCNVIFPSHPRSKRALDRIAQSRFMVSSETFGYGRNGFRLVPFFSVAVDPEVIKLGSVVRIPDFVGKWVTLPDGTRGVHDGLFLAVDTGKGIEGRHVDVHHGTLTDLLPGVGGWEDVQVVEDEAKRLELYLLHCPHPGVDPRESGVWDRC